MFPAEQVLARVQCTSNCMSYTAELLIQLSAQLFYKLAIAMHHTAFVPYSVTAGCSVTGNPHRLLPVLCCLWLSSDPGIFSSAFILLLGIFSDPILSKQLTCLHIVHAFQSLFW